MKNRIKLIAFALIAVFFISCDDFLETTPKDKVSDALIWEKEKSATLYLNYFYTYLHDYGSFGTKQFSKGTLTEGLTETLKYGGYSAGPRAGDPNNYAFTPELMTTSGRGTLLGIWADAYEDIRRINEYLDGQKNFSKLSAEANLLLESQARFFRAFVYFQLAKRHAGSVILYRDMNLVKDKNRAPAEEIWDFIEEDLDYAASNLPDEWDVDNKERITKGAVYAFKSRAMLYAERWEKAVEAADKVFDQAGLYELEDKYEDTWKKGNKEAIIQYNYVEANTGPNHSFDLYYAPYGEVSNGGGMGVPTQEMVELYEKIGGGKLDWSAWHTPQGTQVTPPYDQLEPRFHASIIFNGCRWKGKVMENSVDGTNGRYMDYRSEPNTHGRTVTGYYVRKLMDETNTSLNNLKSSQPWVELRLAEVYLNRAEANFRLSQSGKALDDVNKVRERVGLNKHSGIAGEKLFEAIRQERKIELFLEGHLYWDMRRWKLAHKEYNNYRTHGFKITKNGGAWLYEYVDCDLEERRFLEKTYVLPIPEGEILNNSAIEQFDEWK